MLPKPKSIDDYGGVKSYLNAPEIMALHNNLGYADLYRMLDPRRKYRIPRPVIGDEFGVSKQTIYDWIKRDDTLRTLTGSSRSAVGNKPAAVSERPGGKSTGGDAAVPGNPE